MKGALGDGTWSTFAGFARRGGMLSNCSDEGAGRFIAAPLAGIVPDTRDQPDVAPPADPLGSMGRTVVTGRSRLSSEPPVRSGFARG